MIEDQPRLDVVVVPMGGGGLISGIGVALSQLAPGCRLIGVEAERARRSERHDATAASPHRPQPTIADGLGGNLNRAR
jgi:threonine dehydratase